MFYTVVFRTLFLVLSFGDNSQTTLTATGGTVTKKGGGSWVVTPGSGNTTTLTISGKG